MNKNQLFQQNCGNLAKTLIAKNTDYGSSFDKTFELFGIVAPLVRISDKYNRLISLAQKADNQRMVENETFEDTLFDLAGYCILTLSAIQNSKKSPDNFQLYSNS